MLYSTLLTVSAFMLTATLHLAALRWCSGGMSAIPMAPATRVLSVVVILFVVHLLEIALYAAAFAAGELWLSLGSFSGEPVTAPLDYLYFSATTYTSLGIGDVYPIGHLRFLTGVEALNGLLLIAWSASFLFAMMNRLWDWQTCAVPDRHRKR